MGKLAGPTGRKQDRCNQCSSGQATTKSNRPQFKNNYIPPTMPAKVLIFRAPAGLYQVSLYM